MKNLKNKTRKVDNPYEVWEQYDGSRLFVLKRTQNPEQEAKNQWSIVNVFVDGPYPDYGTIYARDLKREWKKIFDELEMGMTWEEFKKERNIA